MTPPIPPPVVLVDDVRSFRDGRPCLLARTRAAAIALLTNLAASPIAELWLDWDLGTAPDGRPVTARTVVNELVGAVRDGRPYNITIIRIHTANPSGAVWMLRQLRGAGYTVERTHNLRVFINRRSEGPS